MQRLVSSLLFLFVVGPCWAQTPSALQADPEGWMDIMPDPAFKEWTRLPFLTTNPLDPVSQWKVDTANKLLICEGDHGHEFLRYDKELANAIFHVEWRFVPIPEGKGYNSGVMIRNSADGKLWHQAQAGDENAGYLFGNTDVKGEAQRVNTRSRMKEKAVKPVGEWNTYELRAEGPAISLRVNGVLMPDLADIEILKGYAGLEAEGFHIQFRNIMLSSFRKNQGIPVTQDMHLLSRLEIRDATGLHPSATKQQKLQGCKCQI